MSVQRHPRWIWSLALAALTTASTGLAQRPGASRGAAVGQLQDSLVERLVKPRLAPDEMLLPPVFAGALGPPGRSILALTDSGVGNYGGFALVYGSDGWVQQRLPPLGANAGSSLDAVLFDTAPGDSVPRIICIATYVYTHGAHAGEEHHENAVLRWNGASFEHLPDVERRIRRLTTGAAVRRALHARGPG